MDRKIVWPGQVPLETDLLGTNRNVMIALGRLAMDILGTSTLVSGLAASPTSPASMSVSIGAGAIYSLQPVDGTAYSSLPANTTDYILKQGINTTSDGALLTFTAPGTSGQSVIYLIQAAYSEVDTDSTVLPFYNASNPAVPYSGPSGTGASSATTRAGNINLAIKAGVPASSPTAPAADTGFVPLYYVTVAYGQTTITGANIAVATGAPFIPATLTQIASSAISLASAAEAAAGTSTTKAVTPAGLAAAIQAGGWAYAADTGTANALVVALTPAPSAYTAGMQVNVKVANNSTGAATVNVNGLGAKTIQRNGAALGSGALVAGQIYRLIYDGTYFQMTPTSEVASLAANGYVKLSSGLIIQWAVTSSFSSEGGQTVTFPIAFPNACLAVVATPDLPSASSSQDAIAQVYSKTVNSVGVYMQFPGSGTTTWGMTADLIAIGF